MFLFHPAEDRSVVGSNPTRGTFYFVIVLSLQSLRRASSAMHGTITCWRSPTKSEPANP